LTPVGASQSVRFTRRAFMLGAAGSAALVACGESGTSSDDDTVTTAAGGPTLGALFNPGPDYATVGQPQRLTFGVFDEDGAPLSAAPPELEFQLMFGTELSTAEPVGDPMTAALHADGLPRGYYPVRFTPDRQGVWIASTEIDGQRAFSRFQVGSESQARAVAVGARMPSVATATAADSLGVAPLCTRDTPCSFHELSLADALDAGGPVVVSVSTPAYCQVAICGPVLELVIAAAPDYDDITFVHVEPFQRPVPGNPSGNGTVEAMSALGLDFEPVLFLVGADGKVADRLDFVYDTAELANALDWLVA
jgi:hypothetical protein